MKFEDLMKTYIQNSSCNFDQARIIWNAAIEEAAKLSNADLSTLQQSSGVDVINTFHLT